MSTSVDAGSESAVSVTRLLTAEQLAERWQVSKGQVYSLARNGQIPTVRVGRYYRFKAEQIERWEESQ